MKLYRASVSWRCKGDRKFWEQSGFILAEDAKEAREIFVEKCSLPHIDVIAERGLFFVYEVESGMYFCPPTKS